ncbi:hypothetical protein [Shewanella algae]|uniref:hypothetical protein n=1 Tax=Shewanella algae TaxID=38313 RepID=UPI00313AE549
MQSVTPYFYCLAGGGSAAVDTKCLGVFIHGGTSKFQQFYAAHAAMQQFSVLEAKTIAGDRWQSQQTQGEE